MATVNAALQDEAIDHAVDLQRYSMDVVRRMIALLNRSDARLAAQLSEALLRLDAASFTVERLEATLAAVRATNRAAYDAILVALESDLRNFAEYEAAYEVRALHSPMPAAVALQVPVYGVPAEQVYAAALARPFQGRLLADWVANLEESRATAIRNAVRLGFVEGRTVPEIVRSIRGTRALNYADGLLARPRRELEAVVRTAISHTAQTARQLTYDANADIVKALKWVSTLDGRTSPMCRIRDGLEYTATVPHKPVGGHKVPWGDGPGRLHFNCRSVSVPVLKSWRELGLDADEVPPATRASMDGQVPADTTYGSWLARQSAARQDEILGPERGRLLRSGEVSFDKFYDDRGRWLTLDQLRQREGLTPP
ncbi:phage minor head protein [Pseudoxanthomonas sp. PXM05]|uniref:phage minor head protein n=1 Tax=Pseudoxanthomonas sp. PXM05 TaxID=2854775 RepID=UPI001C44E3E2|nr:phage minor head protein [Pseudoxanthomonas sp. PXM05]MBV7475387.1 phage head morphogenesis protein [Pseudoxanthomonas sp. PXM05]